LKSTTTWDIYKSRQPQDYRDDILSVTSPREHCLLIEVLEAVSQLIRTLQS